MKCYDVYKHYITEGLPIVTATGARPYVAVKTSRTAADSVIKLLLDDEIADKFRGASCDGLFQLESARLLACDFEQRSDYWLKAETGGAQKKALVLLHAEAETRGAYNCTGKALISSNGDGSEIVAEQQLVESDPGSFSRHGSFWAGHVALVVMVPDSSVTIESGAYKNSGLTTAAYRARKNITVKKLVMRGDATLEWSK